MGLNKMGITSSLEQAMALQCSAKVDEVDADLSLQEFSELLFSNDETFKLDLARLKAPSCTQVDEVNAF